MKEKNCISSCPPGKTMAKTSPEKGGMELDTGQGIIGILDFRLRVDISGDQLKTFNIGPGYVPTNQMCVAGMWCNTSPGLLH